MKRHRIGADTGPFDAMEREHSSQARVGQLVQRPTRKRGLA